MKVQSRPFASLSGIVLVTLVVLTSCGSATQPAAEGALALAGTETSVETGSTDHQLPADFLVDLYQGEDVLGGSQANFSAALAHGKPIVLNLWAGLCPPCRLEMPDFQTVYGEYGDRVVFFGLDVGPFTSLGTSEQGQALIQELGVTYPAGTTADANVVREYGLIGMPATFFIMPSGEVHQTWTGVLTEEKLGEMIVDLLEASQQALSAERRHGT